MYIQEITVHKTLTKITYIEKPDDNDRQVLGLYFGKKGTDFTIAKAHEIRKDLRKKPGTQIEGKKIIQGYDNQICSLINYLDEIYGKKSKLNELLLDLVVNFPIIDQYQVKSIYFNDSCRITPVLPGLLMSFNGIQNIIWYQSFYSLFHFILNFEIII